MNNNNPYGQMVPNNQFNPYQQIQQIQQMFPQPQGSVYSINTPTEIGNVPIGSTGLSVAICLPESVMYIKSFQNSNPVIMAYRISPYTREEKSDLTEKAPTQEDPVMQRLQKLEEQMTTLISEGGKFNGLL